MKIVLIQLWHSENMGYTDNMLPKYLAKLGHEVHLITSNGQIYFNSPEYSEVYEDALGGPIVGCGVKKKDGYYLHRLPFYNYCPFKKFVHRFEYFGILGVYEYLEKIKRDIIQTLYINTISSYHAAKYAKDFSVSLFTECHIHKSVFNPKNKLINQIYNNINPFLRKINNQTKYCYAIASDVEQIVRDYYKLSSSKIKLESLGVDTEVFYPALNENEIKEKRKDLGFDDNDIIVIYTGRFTKDKNPHCLANAIEILQHKSLSYKAIFIGSGNSFDNKYLASKKGTTVISFLSTKELAVYYQIANIGVWPRQESTSQLDAMACGLPLILSNKIEALERIDGNGYLYNEDDSEDLAKKIHKMFVSNDIYSFSKKSSEKIKKDYSWLSIAENRIKDYNNTN